MCFFVLINLPNILENTQVSDDEDTFLTVPFSEKEVRKLIFQMEHKKAPGPDGFPTEFYQNIWNVIRTGLLHQFGFLRALQSDLFLLNFGEIILLPKINDGEFDPFLRLKF